MERYVERERETEKEGGALGGKENRTYEGLQICQNLQECVRNAGPLEDPCLLINVCFLGNPGMANTTFEEPKDIVRVGVGGKQRRVQQCSHGF